MRKNEKPDGKTDRVGRSRPLSELPQRSMAFTGDPEKFNKERKTNGRATSPRALKDQSANLARARYRAIALTQADKLSALFSQWTAEDATDDPEELKRRDAEMLELQHALNENRKVTGERLPFPELEVRTSNDLEKAA